MSDGRLLPMLHAIQAEQRCLSEDALRRVACELGLPLADVAGVAAYYPAFRTHPAGRHTVQLCLGTACYVQGGELLEDTLRRRLAIPLDGDTDPAGEYTLQKVACIGCCSQAPVVQIEDRIYGHLRGELVDHVIADFEAHRGSTNGATLRPPPAAEAQGELWVGLDSCCTARGSRRVAAALQQAIETVGVTVRIKHVSCAGICAQTPMVEVRLPGDDWFDLKLSFNPSDMKRVNQVFEEVLKPGRESSPKRVQKKFYLQEKLIEKLRLRAAQTGKSQSDLVEDALARAEES